MIIAAAAAYGVAALAVAVTAACQLWRDWHDWL